MTSTLVTSQAFWEARLAPVTPAWYAEAQRIVDEAEPRRAVAHFNTGSITVAASVALRALSEWVAPEIIIEVGTFIGVSTMSLRASRIYTCDVSNHCLPSSDTITCFPYCTSTQMLHRLRKLGIHAQLVFLDGLLSTDDVQLLVETTTPDVVIAFDDFYVGPPVGTVKPSRKGVFNASLLQRRFPQHVLLEPTIPDTTIAVLVPELRL